MASAANSQARAQKAPTAQQKRGRPVCPHSTTRIRNKSQLPENEKEECRFCDNAWFVANEEGYTARPVRITHCGHVCCEQCFDKQRAIIGLACPFGWCHRVAELNLDSCQQCVDYEVEHHDADRDANRAPNEPVEWIPGEPEKFVLTVRQDMFKDLDMELKDLAADDDMFKIPKRYKAALHSYWKAVLKDFEGQYHRHADLAEILDPFRGADVLHHEAIEAYGPELRQPMPTDVDRGFLAVDPALAAEFPDGIEPWISTMIRTWTSRLSEEEGEWVICRLKGVILRRHENNAALRDEDGTWVEDFPIKRIVMHRPNMDGETEYLVEFLGCPVEENEWVLREDFGRPKVWQKYHLQHNIPMPS